MILGGAKKSEKQHRDIFKIHICYKAMLDFNFKLKYSNRESEKPEIVKFMSNVLPCPCEFNGDLVRFRVRTDWGLAIFCAAEIRLKLRFVVAKNFPYCLTVKMK